MNVYNVLLRPIVTEKSTFLQAMNKYVFEVDKHANKYQIKAAVEKTYNVSVQEINTINIPGERRRVGRSGKNWTQTRDWKKAVVTLKEGHKLTLVEGL